MLRRIATKFSGGAAKYHDDILIAPKQRLMAEAAQRARLNAD
jgi:hypothetical protein